MEQAILARTGHVSNSNDIGNIIRSKRRQLGMTLKILALTSGTGVRFLVDLEKGKATCQLEKTLRVIQTLGMKILIESKHHAPPELGDK